MFLEKKASGGAGGRATCSQEHNVFKTPTNMSLAFSNFRPAVLNCGVQERVRLVTVFLLPLPMVQVADHAMYVHFNQTIIQLLMTVVLKRPNTVIKNL